SPLRAFLRTFSFGVSFVLLRFRLYQTVSSADFLGAFQVSRFRAFPFQRFRLYQILSGLIPGRTRVAFPAVGPFRRPKP
ncbi:hypothetical protein, partial [Streptomyces candidus]|uniref:hypothetical protein n=1 Tax=Streptomyces candidus TaxID=67283 RepID=UPI001C869DA7